MFYQTADKPTLPGLSEAFTESLKEGHFYFLRLTNHGVDVFQSTRPEKNYCRQNNEGDHILCSVFNVDVTFNILHLVSLRILKSSLGCCNGKTYHATCWARFVLRSGRDSQIRPGKPQNEAKTFESWCHDGATDTPLELYLPFKYAQTLVPTIFP